MTNGWQMGDKAQPAIICPAAKGNCEIKDK